MITEIAILNIKKGESALFKKAFYEARQYIINANGYISHELLKCLEEGDKFLLIVKWETLKAHTEGFRKSAEYEKWKALLHHFYNPFPLVEHYEKVY